MADELYEVLGIGKDASPAVVRNAYRALAKKYHPDLNPGDKAAEETFKKIQAANDILSDGEKRRQYDAGEIDGDGRETRRQFYREYAGNDQSGPYASSAGFDDLGDIFSNLFRNQRQGQGNVNVKMQGGDIRYHLDISFLDAVMGAKRRVAMPDGKSLDITIPGGHRDGQILRLRGKGMPGIGGGLAGDAYVEIAVQQHPYFRRQDGNILIKLPVALHEAVLGGKVPVPTVHGQVTMMIPAGTNSGDILRLKNKGVPGGGDQLVTVDIVLPKKIDGDLKTFLEKWSQTHAYDPRVGMGV